MELDLIGAVLNFFTLLATISVPIVIFCDQKKADERTGQILNAQNEVLDKISDDSNLISDLVEKINDQSRKTDMLISSINDSVAMTGLIHAIEIESLIESKSKDLMVIPDSSGELKNILNKSKKLKEFVGLIQTIGQTGGLQGYRGVPFVPLPGYEDWIENNNSWEDILRSKPFLSRELADLEVNDAIYVAYAEKLIDRYNVEVPQIFGLGSYPNQFYGIKEYITYGKRNNFSIPWVLIARAFCSNQNGILNVDIRFYESLFREHPELITPILKNINMPTSSGFSVCIDDYKFKIIAGCVSVAKEILAIGHFEQSYRSYAAPDEIWAEEFKISLLKAADDIANNRYFYLSEKGNGETNSLFYEVVFLLAILAKPGTMDLVNYLDVLPSFFREWRKGSGKTFGRRGRENLQNMFCHILLLFEDKGMDCVVSVIEGFIEDVVA